MAPRTTQPRRTPSRNDRRQAAVHRRRQEVAHRTAAARKSARRRRAVKAMAGVAAAAVVISGVVFLVGRGGDDGPPAELRAEKVAGAAGALALSPLPTVYQATYRAESYEGGATTVSTEEVAVRRPFDGRVAIKEGSHPVGPPGSRAAPPSASTPTTPTPARYRPPVTPRRSRWATSA